MIFDGKKAKLSTFYRKKEVNKIQCYNNRELSAINNEQMNSKKRNTSGSRSVYSQSIQKSKKSKGRQNKELSTDVRALRDNHILNSHKDSHTLNTHQHTSKLKTDNSLSVNKSKGKKQKNTKKNNKPSYKQSKVYASISQNASRSASAQHRHSPNKMNKTETNYQNNAFQRKVKHLKKSLSKIQKPQSLSIKALKDFYAEIRDAIQSVNQPIYSLCIYLHTLYEEPLLCLTQIISPYEDLIRKRQQLSNQIDNQIKQNEKIYSQFDETDVQIYKLMKTIERQRIQIDEKRRIKQQKLKQQSQKLFIKKQPLQANINNLGNFNAETEIQNSGNQHPLGRGYEAEVELNEQQKQMDKFGGKGFKLDLQGMSKNVGFHDEFYSKLEQFSESWRNQALRQKRF